MVLLNEDSIFVDEFFFFSNWECDTCKHTTTESVDVWKYDNATKGFKYCEAIGNNHGKSMVQTLTRKRVPRDGIMG
jgi:hypothetical protein